MNKVRKKVLSNMCDYLDFAEHKDLIAFSVGADYFTYDHKTGMELTPDFTEIVTVVEKDWLFELMRKEFEIDDPLMYLQNEYTWDDSILWFDAAKLAGKVVLVSFD